MRSLAITIDVEEDLSQYLSNSFRGVTQALPEILDFLIENDLPCDFFVNARICQEHPDTVKMISQQDYLIGCHGLDHRVQYLCTKGKKWQRDTLRLATTLVSETIGKRVQVFRAPNFSADTTTIRILEELDYEVDSSVLPGRVVRRAGLMKILDFRGAPRQPYHPDSSDLTSRGDSKILEVPVTENPLSPGAPIGLGFLNSFGQRKAFEALSLAQGEPVIFLVHPWEFVDLALIDKDLPDWIGKACKHEPIRLKSFLIKLGEKFQLTSLKSFLGKREK